MLNNNDIRLEWRIHDLDFSEINSPEALNVLPSLIVFFTETPNVQLVEKFLLNKVPETTAVIICFSGIQEMSLRQLINGGRIRKFICFTKNTQWQEELLNSILNLGLSMQRKRLELEAYSKKYRELESLNENLQHTVNESTQGIEKSNEVLSERNFRERNLYRYLKEINEKQSILDVLDVFRKEINKNSNITNPILFFCDDRQTIQVFYYHAGRFQLRKVPGDHLNEFKEIFDLKNPGRLSQSQQKHMADVLQRPVGLSIYFPMEFLLSRKALGFDINGILIFEINKIENEAAVTHLLISDQGDLATVIRGLSLVLDRVYIQNKIDLEIKNWRLSFDEAKNGIAIIDEDFRIVRANKKFKKFPNNNFCYQVFANRNEVCPNCPIKTAFKANDMPETVLNKSSFFSVRQGGGADLQIGSEVYQVFSSKLENDGMKTKYVHQYLEVGSMRSLQAEFFQNEKLLALGDLAKNVAHELNNPLGGILTLTQSLKMEIDHKYDLDKDLNDKQSLLLSDLGEIEKATLRSLSIIQSFLRFSAEDSIEVIDFKKIIRDTIPLLKIALRTHRLNLDLSDFDVRVRGKFSLLQQVIFNLLNNAAQAMKSAGTIDVQLKLNAKHIIELRVSDTGPGVPEAERENIFKSFYSNKTDGTGLGLSISRSIVEKFGGKIWCESNSQGGACFVMTLPRVD